VILRLYVCVGRGLFVSGFRGLFFVRRMWFQSLPCLRRTVGSFFPYKLGVKFLDGGCDT